MKTNLDYFVGLW